MRTDGTTRTSCTRQVLTGCVALLLATAHGAAAQRPFERIVVFGDSLSDTGNAFTLLGASSTPPDYGLSPFLVPSAPYARGGLHFSNGATWIEQFARPLGLAGSVRPAFRGSNPGATNYSVGASRAYDDGSNVNLSVLVGIFLQQFGGVAPGDALYVIEMGGNDVRDALAVFAGGGDGAPILQASLASIAQNIQTLYASGARTFLVWNVPDIGLTPAVRTLDAAIPGAVALATMLTVSFNAELEALLAQLSAARPGIELVKFDMFHTIHQIAANPASFGLTDVVNACVTPGDPPFACRNPDEFLFWDGIHPTKAVHAIVARQALDVLVK
jgi:phospholipase/lecithinase/hemolysin